MDVKQRIVEEARRLGFPNVAVARADVPLEADYARYEAFIGSGKHGEMGWLAEAPDARRRLDGDEILAGARSVICLAYPYGRAAEDEAADPPTARAIARYARGRDYHNALRKKVRKLAGFVRRLGAAPGEVRARPICDAAPVLERAWAARAGLGFVGKNGLLIVPGVGSLVLLGEVVTTLTLAPDTPLPGRCGSCTRCLDVCPTEAFAAPFVLDARRCVAYLTIEHRSAVPPELRAGVGVHLFGCDDCQTVCPFNAHTRAHGGAIDPRLLPDPRWADVTPERLLGLDDEAFDRLTSGSPVGRATRAGLARNAAIALGNAGDEGARPALERALSRHDDEDVREAAAWALRSLDARAAR